MFLLHNRYWKYIFFYIKKLISSKFVYNAYYYLNKFIIYLIFFATKFVNNFLSCQRNECLLRICNTQNDPKGDYDRKIACTIYIEVKHLLSVSFWLYRSENQFCPSVLNARDDSLHSSGVFCCSGSESKNIFRCFLTDP